MAGTTSLQTRTLPAEPVAASGTVRDTWPGAFSTRPATLVYEGTRAMRGKAR